MKTLALSLNSSADTLTDKYITDVLIPAGLVEKDVNGIVTLTAAGQEKIDQIVNGALVNEPNAALGGKTFLSGMAEQMAIADYTVGGVSSWESVSETKRTEILKEYQSWIYNNQDSLRVSSWELYELDNEGDIVIDRYWATPDIAETNIYKEGVNMDSGIAVENLTLEHVESDTETQEYLDQVKKDIISGKIADGAYITFSTDKAKKDDKFYYVYNGHVYETEYTMENPPKQIDVNSASVYSFGKFSGTGKGDNDKQDKWIEEVIKSAKAGKLPDGVYIDFNFGLGMDYYKYSNGSFIKVDPSEVEFIDKNGNKYKPEDAEDRSAAMNVLYAGNFLSEGMFTKSLATEEYTDW